MAGWRQWPDKLPNPGHYNLQTAVGKVLVLCYAEGRDFFRLQRSLLLVLTGFHVLYWQTALRTSQVV